MKAEFVADLTHCGLASVCVSHAELRFLLEQMALLCRRAQIAK